MRVLTLEADDAEHLVHPAAGDAVALSQAEQMVIGPAAAVQRLGVEEGAHLAHGGGLPGAVRAEEAGDQAGPDGERQVADGRGGAVALRQVVGFDHRSTANGTARSQ
jgi:hypothetical protein